MCLEKTDVPEDRWTIYDLLIPTVQDLVLLLLSDPAEGHEPPQNQEGIRKKMDELITNLKSITD